MKFLSLKGYIPTWFWGSEKVQEAPKEVETDEILPFLQWLNIYVIKCKELSQWKNRVETLGALAVLHVLYILMGSLSLSVLSLGAWTGLLLFSHYTLRVRLWSTISISPKPPPQPSNGDLEAFLTSAHSTAGTLIRLRARSPGFFFISTLFSLLILAYVGTLVSGFLLIYILNMAILAAPFIYQPSSSACEKPDIDLPDDSLESFDILEPLEIFKDSGEYNLLPGVIPGVEDEEDSLREEDFLPLGFRETLGL